MVRQAVFKKIDPRGSIYNENKIGPITEPWGTPQVTGTVDETKLPYFTEDDHGIILQKQTKMEYIHSLNSFTTMV